ncbi:DNA cytosine methyltransferase, partial [Pseudomonas urmiensis]|uniref:DNA cytosine methyltransferase n=1 Tax=Pseudomonas urmiensis TaxID=2745493 RepID=UPI0034D5D42F
GRTWKRILDELGDGGLGYEVKTAKLSPHNFSIPQIRERIYIVGSIESLENFEWPAISSQETSINSILEDSPSDAKQLSRRASDCLEVWQDFIERCPENVELPWFPLWSMEWGATYPYEDETPFTDKTMNGEKALKGY